MKGKTTLYNLYMEGKEKPYKRISQENRIDCKDQVDHYVWHWADNWNKINKTNRANIDVISKGRPIKGVFGENIDKIV